MFKYIYSLIFIALFSLTGNATVNKLLNPGSSSTIIDIGYTNGTAHTAATLSPKIFQEIAAQSRMIDRAIRVKARDKNTSDCITDSYGSEGCPLESVDCSGTVNSINGVASNVNYGIKIIPSTSTSYAAGATIGTLGGGQVGNGSYSLNKTFQLQPGQTVTGTSSFGNTCDNDYSIVSMNITANGVNVATDSFNTCQRSSNSKSYKNTSNVAQTINAVTNVTHVYGGTDYMYLAFSTDTVQDSSTCAAPYLPNQADSTQVSSTKYALNNAAYGSNSAWDSLLNTYSIAPGTLNAKFFASVAGTYTFAASGDNHANLSIDGVQIISNAGFGSSMKTTTKTLTAGEHSLTLVGWNDSGPTAMAATVALNGTLLWNTRTGQSTAMVTHYNSCRLDYTYYTYSCPIVPSTEQAYVGPVVSSGGDCGGIGINSSNQCNSPTPPAGNCVRTLYTCPISGSTNKCIKTPDTASLGQNVFDGFIYSAGDAIHNSKILTEEKNCGTSASESATNTCDTGFVYNNVSKKCEQTANTCNSGFIYNTATNSCTQAPQCPIGGIYDVSTNKCQGNPTNTCSDTSYTYNATTLQCEKSPVCSIGTYSTTYNKCLISYTPTCDTANGYTYNSTRNECERAPQCPSGQVYDSTYNACSPGVSACPSGYIWNNSTQNCSNCPSGTTWNSGSNLCIDSGHGITDYITATNVCSNKSMRFPSAGEATTLPSIGGGEIWSSYQWFKVGVAPGCGSYPRTDYVDAYNGTTRISKLENAWCTGIHYESPTSAFWCVVSGSAPIAGSCPTGQVINTNGICMAIPTCPASTGWIATLDGTLDVCKTTIVKKCVTGTTYDATSNSCLSTPICNNGSLDTVQDKCAQSKTNGCPIGYIFNTSISQCQANSSCSAPSTLNTTTDFCSYTSCLGGTVVLGVCEKTATKTCSLGLTYNASKDICEMVGNTCVSDPKINCLNSTYDTVTNKCYVSNDCPGGIINATTNLCEIKPDVSCPIGFTLNMGMNRCEKSSQCTFGTVNDAGTTCQEDYTCPSGYTKNLALGRCEKPIVFGTVKCSNTALTLQGNNCHFVGELSGQVEFKSYSHKGFDYSDAQILPANWNNFQVNWKEEGFSLARSAIKLSDGYWYVKASMASGDSRACGWPSQFKTLPDSSYQVIQYATTCYNGGSNIGNACALDVKINIPSGLKMVGYSDIESVAATEFGTAACNGDNAYDEQFTLQSSSIVTPLSFTRNGIGAAGSTPLTISYPDEVPSCNSGYTYDAQNNVCYQNVPGYSVDVASGVIYGTPTCLHGTFNSDTKMCQASTTCSSGIKDDVNNVCYDTQSYTCSLADFTLINSTSISGYSKTCSKSLCTSGIMINGVLSCEVPSTTECPTGYLLKPTDNKCYKAAECKPGYIVTTDNKCQLEYFWSTYTCPTGFIGPISSGADCLGECSVNGCWCNGSNAPANNCRKSFNLNPSAYDLMEHRRIEKHLSRSNSMDKGDFGEMRNLNCGPNCQNDVNRVVGSGSDLCFFKPNDESKCFTVEGCYFYGEIENVDHKQLSNLRLFDPYTIGSGVFTPEKYVNVTTTSTTTVLDYWTFQHCYNGICGWENQDAWGNRFLTQTAAQNYQAYILAQGSNYTTANPSVLPHYSDVTTSTTTPVLNNQNQITETSGSIVSSCRLNGNVGWSTRVEGISSVSLGGGIQRWIAIDSNGSINLNPSNATATGGEYNWEGFNIGTMVLTLSDGHQYVSKDFPVDRGIKTKIQYLPNSLYQMNPPPTGSTPLKCSFKGTQTPGYCSKSLRIILPDPKLTVISIEELSVTQINADDSSDNDNNLTLIIGDATSGTLNTYEYKSIGVNPQKINLLPEDTSIDGFVEDIRKDRLVFWDSYKDGDLGFLEFTRDVKNEDRLDGFVPEKQTPYLMSKNGFTGINFDVKSGRTYFAKPSKTTTAECSNFATSVGGSIIVAPSSSGIDPDNLIKKMAIESDDFCLLFTDSFTDFQSINWAVKKNSYIGSFTFKCSPYICDTTGQCEIDTCPHEVISGLDTEYIGTKLPDIYAQDVGCRLQKCDGKLATIPVCGLDAPGCDITLPNVYMESGKCYEYYCPVGMLNQNGMCEVFKCPFGTTETATGMCSH